MITSHILVPRTVYGEPSGNYDGSSLDWWSDPIKAANYYRGQGHVQTINFNLDQVIGKIIIQATLQSFPGTFADEDYITNKSWFQVAEIGDDVFPTTEYRVVTVQGNFTWIRANITDFQSGIIQAVTVVY
jgi:hypothetical protein